MGLFGNSRQSELRDYVRQVNTYIQSVIDIYDRVKGDSSKLDSSDINTLRILGHQILIEMNNVSNLVEKDRSLISTSVYGFSGKVSCMAWMSWAMQWFNSFENQFKPYL